MAVNISATRTSTLFDDKDLDGQFDPGDIITTRIRITVGPGDDALGVQVNASTNGLTVDAGDPEAVQVTPIAFDDFMPSITGNTPITFTASQLLGNDVDPDGAEINLVIGAVSSATNGAIVNNGNGTFTFTPTTGYVGTASFQYTVTDEDGLASVSTGVVSFTVTDPVWYVDASYSGVNGASDGSYLKPFTTLAQLSTGGIGDSFDNADDTIFVYNSGTYSSGIVLEAGQKLIGDGHAFSVNGITIGANASNATINHAGAGVTLSTDNTIYGVTLNGTANGAVGIEDGGGSVGTLTIDETSITGLGKAIDIDQGGTLAVDLDQLSSASSTSEGVHLQGVTGTFNASTGIIQTSTGTGVLIGAAGGGTASSGGNVNFTYGGDISSPGGSVVEIQDRTGGTVTFTGSITEGSIAAGTTGILVDGSAGTVNFNGQTFVSAGGLGGNGVTLTNNSGTINFLATGTGLDITTATGSGLTFTGGGTLNVTGAANSITTGTGQVLNLQNGTMGTSGIAFQTLSSGNVASGNAINIVNLDAAGAGVFSGGAVTIGGTAGAGADGINISGGSASTFNFASATIDNTAGDGIELNGANGTVTFTTVNLDGMSGAGVNIVNATNAVNINGGTIGATNDPAGDGVTITGGTGAVTVAAAITKTSGGNEVVDISTHSGGAISFSGALTASGGGGGIRLANNSGGNIDFTGDVTLNTGTLNAINFTNTGATGANVTFSEGSLDVDTTSGTGINATSTTVGAGSLTISGATGLGNIVSSTTGRAINIDGVTSNITLNEVNVTGGGTTTGVFLKNTGSGGQFVVTGDGSTAGSGGAIANIGGADLGSPVAAATQGTGIYMENVSNVSLSNMNFTGTFTNFGIRGENVNNFTLRDSSLTGTFGDNVAFDEDAIRFGTGGASTGLTGTALFDGNTIQGGRENNLSVYLYGSNTLNMTVKDSVNDQAVFGNNSTGSGSAHALAVESGGTSNLTLNVTGATFNGANGNLISVTSTGSATQNIQVTNNTLHNTQATTLSGGAGVLITGSLTNSNITYNIDGNSFKGTTGASIYSMFNGNSGTVTGIVNNNTFGTANGVADSLQANYGSLNGGAFFGGIDSKFAGTGTINYALRISNNTIRDSGSDGVILLRSANQGLQGIARVEATIINNTIAEARANVAAGVYLQVAGSGHVSGDNGRIGVNMTGNTINLDNAIFADAVYVDNGSSLNGVAYFPGYAGPANPFTELSTFLDANNNWSAGSQDSGTGGASVNGPVSGSAFVLPAPAMAGTPDVGGGWQDQADLYVTAPPRDPDPVAAGDEETAGGTGGTGGTDSGDTGGADGTGGTGESGGTPPAVVDDGLISAAELDLLVEAAIQRWIDAGASAAQVEAMRAVQFGIVDMAGIYVGTSTHGVINIDNDAAGYGWFVDSTPGEDSEFEGSGSRLTADVGGAAAGKLDLLTVLMHELGHQIGLGDEYGSSNGSELMYGYVNSGERRLPAQGEAAGAVPGSVGSTAYAITPVNIGTIPAGKTVDVFIKATIDAQTDGFIVDLVNDATISGSNFSNQVIQEMLALDGLTLGNMVFLDVNRDGDYDAGTDSGIVGVDVDLYADTNDSGDWDAGDVFLGTTTTLAGGLYSFAGLAPGDYVVVVKSTNFGSGEALEGLQVTTGTAADPDDNVDGDNNGADAAGGNVAAQTITLDYNTEPTPGVGNDTNNTLDFGFVANAPPVANDDSVTVVEDSGANDLTSQVLGNDTDPEDDPRTVTSATQGANGTTSVVAGVLTYTPNANYSGSDSFTYTIDDGNGNTDTGTVTVTVTGVNDAPVPSLGATVLTTEDAVNVSLGGMSISDVDADPATDEMYVTFVVDNGALDIRTDVAGGIVLGDIVAQAVNTITVVATLNEINATLAAANGITYTPDANFNVTDTLTVYVNDSGASGADPGISGDGTSEEGIATRTITVSAVNDAPVVVGDGTEEAATIVEDIPGPGETVSSLFAGQYSDAADAQFGAGNPSGSSPGAFSGVAVVANGSSPATGQWQYYNSSTDTWVDIGARSTSSALLIANTTLIRFNPALDFFGAAPTLTVHLIDNSLGFGISFGQIVDISGPGATGGTTAYSTGTVVLSQTVDAANLAPTVDLNGAEAGVDNSASYTEQAPIVTLAADLDLSDDGTTLTGATVQVTSGFVALAGDGADYLGIAGSGSGTVGGISYSYSALTGILTLSGSASVADYQAVLRQVSFQSTANDAGTSRTITWTVTDGTATSTAVTTTIAVTDDDADAPAGTDATITAIEDSFRLLAEADFGFVDVDGTFAGVTISGVSGGGIYWDADGSAGAGGFVLETLPKTYSKQDLIDGKVAFRADPNLEGSGVATITFAVTDDDGLTDASPNTLTVDVTGVNDAPVLDTSAGDTAYSEGDTPVVIDPGVTVSDIDDLVLAGQVQILNGSAGDLLTFVNNDSAAFGDIAIEAGSSDTVLNLRSSSGTATLQQWENALRSITYSTTSDNPSTTTRNVAFIVNDGTDFSTYETKNIVVTGVNDAPTLDLNGAGAGTDATLSYTENAAATPIAPLATFIDPDTAILFGGTLTVGFTAGGSADDRLTIVNQGTGPGQIGVSGNAITYEGNTIGTFSGGTDGSTPLVVTFNLSAYPTPTAVQALMRQIGYSNVSDNPGTSRTVEYVATDGDGGTSAAVTATINITTDDDAPVAQPDAVSTPENVIGTGSLLANNGSGPDSDPDSATITVSHVNGVALVSGNPIVLASGAILIVNSDGTYSYNPNGKFNTLTDNSSGAVNTSGADSFTYTVTGGNTVTVTVTVNGVAGPGDILRGDSGDNTITGTPQVDLFYLQDGGSDTVYGLASNDGFIFGGALDALDYVDGGAGINDQLVLQGDYSALTVLGANVLINVEVLSIIPGSDTRFGDISGSLYDYNLRTVDSNVAAGGRLVVDFTNLGAGEDVTFDGSAETDGAFTFGAGFGVDNLTGGSGADLFLFRGGRFGASDQVNGGGGNDELALRGNHTIVFGAGAMTGIEVLSILSGQNTRFGKIEGDFDYSITTNDANVAATRRLVVDGGQLTAEESLAFNGSAETDGYFWIAGGGGNDVLTGGQGNDLIFGGGRGDTLTGGGGNDTFAYRATTDSNSTERDGIQDFNAGDLIDLSRIDANTLVVGDQAFNFIGGAAFSNTAGELRFENISAGGPIWMVQGDVNGDGISDFEVVLVISPADPITSSDFVL